MDQSSQIHSKESLHPHWPDAGAHLYIFKKRRSLKGMEDSNNVCLYNKGIGGQGGHYLGSQGSLHSGNVMHQLNYLWRGLDDSSQGVESEDDKEGHLSSGQHSSNKMGQKRTE